MKATHTRRRTASHMRKVRGRVPGAYLKAGPRADVREDVVDMPVAPPPAVTRVARRRVMPCASRQDLVVLGVDEGRAVEVRCGEGGDIRRGGPLKYPTVRSA